MTLLNTLVTYIFAITCIRYVSAAAFSNVIVRRGPVEYFNYDPATFSFTRPQLAQLSAGPIESVVPIPSISSVVSPCVSPCVIRNETPTGLTPTTTNARIVALKSTLANIPEATGYQYAYAVFDENTGDKKTQSEQSDGSVVQGQYSFIQPDGFRREVIYTADDLKGFNAVVRNISPEPEIQQEENADAKNDTTKPVPVPVCHEAKSEQLIHPLEESLEDGIEHMAEKKIEDISEEKATETITEKSVESAKKSNEIAKSSQPVLSSEENTPLISNAIMSYRDIINCLQAKLKGAQNVESPLTYVLVPSSRSPC